VSPAIAIDRAVLAPSTATFLQKISVRGVSDHLPVIFMIAVD
jgi:hypothetical protein